MHTYLPNAPHRRRVSGDKAKADNPPSAEEEEEDEEEGGAIVVDCVLVIRRSEAWRTAFTTLASRPGCVGEYSKNEQY